MSGRVLRVSDEEIDDSYIASGQLVEQAIVEFCEATGATIRVIRGDDEEHVTIEATLGFVTYGRGATAEEITTLSGWRAFLSWARHEFDRGTFAAPDFGADLRRD